MFRSNFRIAFRTLVRQKASTVINLIGLTVAITTCLVVYFITSYELSYDTFHPDKDRIYRLAGRAHFGSFEQGHPVGFIPNAVAFAVRQEISKIETVAAFQTLESDVLIPQKRLAPKRFEGRKPGLESAEIALVESQYFDIFKYNWLVGNPAKALSEPFKVVLSEKKARKYFGDLPLDTIIGKEVIYRDSIRVTVGGIIQDWGKPTDFTFTEFISYSTIRASPLKQLINPDEWEGLSMTSQAYVKLANGTTPKQLKAPFAQFSKLHFQNVLSFKPVLQPLEDVHFNAEYFDTYTRQAHLPTLYGLMGIAAFILLLATINFVNLATAQSVQRAKEIGIRKVLGSRRSWLVFQFFSETMLLTALATLIAFVVAWPVLSTYSSLMPRGFMFSLIDWNTLLFLLAILVATAFLAGFYPSIVLSAYLPSLTLKGRQPLNKGNKGYVRKGLIVFQFTISIIFIVGSLLIGRQLNFMRTKDLGFSKNAIIELPIGSVEKSRILAQQLKQLADVERVSLQWSTPMSESIMVGKVKFRGETEKDIDVMAKVGDENYLPLYQLRLLAGRNYHQSDTLRELVVNEKLSKELGFSQPIDAINQLIDWRGKLYPIVGVVADFHQQSFHEPIKPTIIGNMPQEAGNLGVKMATKGKKVQKPEQLLGDVEKEWKLALPDEPFEYSFVDDSIAKLFKKEQNTAKLVNTATAIAILISCLGLFGLTVYSTEQRIKEIGIRKILGASVSNILTLINKDFILLMLIAFVIASPAAWWLMNQWLREFNYRINLSWWIFIAAYLIVFAIAILTISLQSIKAALMNPVDTLKNE